jgi:mannose-6-phosphate isomerase
MCRGRPRDHLVARTRGIDVTEPRLQELGQLSAFASETRRVEKPWGYELIYAVTDCYCGKLLFVRAGEALSLQLHRVKDETIYVHTGRVEVEIGRTGMERARGTVGPGHAFRITAGTIHRLRAVEDAVLLEASSPELDDVVRLEDRYGRGGEAPGG